MRTYAITESTISAVSSFIVHQLFSMHELKNHVRTTALVKTIDETAESPPQSSSRKVPSL